MNGSIRKRGKSSWELTVDLGYDSQGRRRRKFVTVKGSKAEAQRQLREILAEHDKGKPLIPAKQTFREFFDHWYNVYVIPQTKASTAAEYAFTAKRYVLPYIGDLPLVRIQASDIQKMLVKLRERGLAATTIRKAYRTANQALNKAVAWGTLYYNPMTTVDRPPVENGPPSILSIEQVQRFLDSIKASPHYALFCFIAYTGCRRGEALGLRWQDVDLENMRVSILQTVYRIAGKGLVMQTPKTDAGTASISVDHELVAVLRAHRLTQLEHRLRLGDIYDDHDLVFPDPLGKPQDPTSVSRTFKRLIKSQGRTDVTLHGLRHFHAAVLIKAGVQAKVIQARLRHASIGVTMDLYGHLFPGLDREAAETFAAVMRNRR